MLIRYFVTLKSFLFIHSYTTESSTAFLFSLDSILGSLSFGRHLTPLDNPPNPLPSFSVVAPSLGPDEALYVLRGAKARKCLRLLWSCLGANNAFSSSFESDQSGPQGS